MLNKILFIFLLLLSISTKTVFASGFNLKSIGGLDTNGRQISHWWYTSTNLTLSGEAAPNSTVNINIDESKETAVATSEGDWSYTPSSLNEGDHKISLENNGSVINFTLTLGADNVDMAAIEKDGNPTTLPTVGVITPTILSLLFGTGLFLTGRKFLKQS
jgi:hypothetical protein